MAKNNYKCINRTHINPFQFEKKNENLKIELQYKQEMGTLFLIL